MVPFTEIVFYNGGEFPPWRKLANFYVFDVHVYLATADFKTAIDKISKWTFGKSVLSLYGWRSRFIIE